MGCEKIEKINGKFNRKKAEIPRRISCLVHVTSQDFHQIVHKKYPSSATIFSVMTHTMAPGYLITVVQTRSAKNV